MRTTQSSSKKLANAASTPKSQKNVGGSLSILKKQGDSGSVRNSKVPLLIRSNHSMVETPYLDSSSAELVQPSLRSDTSQKSYGLLSEAKLVKQR